MAILKKTLFPENLEKYNELSNLQHTAKNWPDDWIQSYKWEMRNKHDLSIVNGKRNFNIIGDPRINPNGCIAVFHGEPNPDQVKDPWVIENWR